jgi:hypothetical protein
MNNKKSESILKKTNDCTIESLTKNWIKRLDNFNNFVKEYIKH